MITNRDVVSSHPLQTACGEVKMLCRLLTVLANVMMFERHWHNLCCQAPPFPYLQAARLDAVVNYDLPVMLCPSNYRDENEEKA